MKLADSSNIVRTSVALSVSGAAALIAVLEGRQAFMGVCFLAALFGLLCGFLPGQAIPRAIACGIAVLSFVVLCVGCSLDNEMLGAAILWAFAVPYVLLLLLPRRLPAIACSMAAFPAVAGIALRGELGLLRVLLLATGVSLLACLIAGGEALLATTACREGQLNKENERKPLWSGRGFCAECVVNTAVIVLALGASGAAVLFAITPFLRSRMC